MHRPAPASPRAPLRLDWRRALAGALLCALPGCATQSDIDKAVDDDVQFTGKIMGFAIDARLESLQTKLAVLETFEKEPKFEELTQRLGTIAQVKEAITRTQAAKRQLLDDHKALRLRYQQEE